MTHDNEHRILQILRTLPFLLVLLFISLFYFINIGDQTQRLETYQQKLISETLEERKAQLTEQVEATINQINYERTQTESVLKNEIKQRIDEAYEIATAIYREESEHSPSKADRLIAEALRPIRFNDNRGYFFIFNMDGTNIMHPLLPHIQGKNRLDTTDARGVHILKEHIELIKQSPDGSAFYRWWFAKPNEEGEFEKIGYGRYFEPLNWFIGTGEYIYEVEQHIQQQLVHWVSTFHHGHGDSLFVADRNGNIISHSDPTLIGKSYPTLAQKALLQIEQNGQSSAFIQHPSHYTDNTNQPENRQDSLSYVQYDEKWQWIIGAGIKLDSVKDETDILLKQLEDQHNSEIINITLILLPLAAILTLFSFALSQYLSKRFTAYQLQISQHFTQLQTQKDQLRYQAEHDSLTELPNRSRFEKEAKRHLLHAHAQSLKVAIFFVDLVHFKRINDQYGHQVGDEVIKQVAKRFYNTCPLNGIIARFGGDEFVWSIPFGNDTEEHIRQTISMINESLEKPLLINSIPFDVNITIGVAIYPDDDLQLKDLMAHADMALTYAKQQRKGRFARYNQDISQEFSNQFLLEDELKHAISRNEISLNYQPQVNCSTGETIGFEALCRWTSPKLGNVPPFRFIDIAERNGFIIELGQFVLNQACKDLRQLQQHFGDKATISVNISPKQLLDTGFLAFLKKSVQNWEVEPSSLTLEITENVLLEDLNFIKPKLEEIRALGFGISLDDFGTGYSSLRYLNTLPISEIKIDRSFVADMISNENSSSVVKTIIAIAHSNHFLTIAEGVETPDQQHALREMGCGNIQGYLHSRPLPLKELLTLLPVNASA